MVTIKVIDATLQESTAKYSERSKRARCQAVRAFHQFIERFPTAVIRLDSESHGRLYYAANKITGDFVADVKPEVPCDVF